MHMNKVSLMPLQKGKDCIYKLYVNKTWQWATYWIKTVSHYYIALHAVSST